MCVFHEMFKKTNANHCDNEAFRNMLNFDYKSLNYYF